jgi:ribosomal protein S27AE
MPDAIPCPKCGVPMNRHAEKLVQPVDERSAAEAGPEGVLLSVHECPRCGWIVDRREGPL